MRKGDRKNWHYREGPGKGTFPGVACQYYQPTVRSWELKTDEEQGISREIFGESAKPLPEFSLFPNIQPGGHCGQRDQALTDFQASACESLTLWVALCQGILLTAFLPPSLS